MSSLVDTYIGVFYFNNTITHSIRKLTMSSESDLLEHTSFLAGVEFSLSDDYDDAGDDDSLDDYDESDEDDFYDDDFEDDLDEDEFQEEDDDFEFEDEEDDEGFD